MVAAVLLVAWQFVLVGDARSSAAVAARAGGARGRGRGRSRRPRRASGSRARLRRGLRVRGRPRAASVSVSVRVPALAGRLDLGRVRADGGAGSCAMTAERGQATVELAALLPLLAVVALAAYATARRASPRVSRPASRPRPARSPCCRTATPRPRPARRCPERRRAATVAGAAAAASRVAVRPRVPLVARLLRTRVSAHAGPEPAP